MSEKGCSDSDAREPIRVALAFSNILFSMGISGLLKHARDIEVTNILMPGETGERMIKVFFPDVVLVDILTLFNRFVDPSAHRSTRFILIDTGVGLENIHRAVSEKGVVGVLQPDATLSTLGQAVQTVASGGSWLRGAASAPPCTVNGDLPRLVAGNGR